MVNSILLTCLFASAFGLGAINEPSNNIQPIKENHLLVSYDDEDYIIRFNRTEFFSYTYENLSSYLSQHSSLSFSGVYWETDVVGDTFTFTDFADGFLSFYSAESFRLTFCFGDDYLPGSLNHFLITDDNDDNVENTTYSDETMLSWNLTQTIYADIKSAIELDIQVNQVSDEPVHLEPSDATAILGDIVSTLVGGITGVATGVGAGVSDLVSSIFLDTNGATPTLSVFGYMIVIFAGISLAIGLSRWVMNFLTSFGAKK